MRNDACWVLLRIITIFDAGNDFFRDPLITEQRLSVFRPEPSICRIDLLLLLLLLLRGLHGRSLSGPMPRMGNSSVLTSSAYRLV